MTIDALEELRGAWARAVKIDGDDDHGPNRMKPCWFAEMRPSLGEHGVDVGPCEGWIEGAHWIKRQRVEAIVDGWIIVEQCRGEIHSRWDEDLTLLAAWDPRNGVAACERHHRRFDGHRMPPLVVPRLLVPNHVVEFVNDWGLETALEDKHPLEV